MEDWRPPHHEALGPCDPQRSGAPRPLMRCQLPALAVSHHRACGRSPEPLRAARTASTVTGVPNDNAAEAPAAGAGPPHPDGAPAASSLLAVHEGAEREKRGKGSREADEEAAFMKKQVRCHPYASRCLELCS